jgi:hypothetical protein
MSYDTAAALCKQHGRKRKNCGMSYPKVLAMLSDLGATRVDHSDGRTFITARMKLNMLDTSKSYVVVVRGHMFAYRHGVILDTVTDHKAFIWARQIGHRKVFGVWEVPQAPAPVQLGLFSIERGF